MGGCFNLIFQRVTFCAVISVFTRVSQRQTSSWRTRSNVSLDRVFVACQGPALSQYKLCLTSRWESVCRPPLNRPGSFPHGLPFSSSFQSFQPGPHDFLPSQPMSPMQMTNEIIGVCLHVSTAVVGCVRSEHGLPEEAVLFFSPIAVFRASSAQFCPNPSHPPVTLAVCTVVALSIASQSLGNREREGSQRPFSVRTLLSQGSSAAEWLVTSLIAPSTLFWLTLMFQDSCMNAVGAGKDSGVHPPTK